MRRIPSAAGKRTEPLRLRLGMCRFGRSKARSAGKNSAAHRYSLQTARHYAKKAPRKASEWPFCIVLPAIRRTPPGECPYLRARWLQGAYPSKKAFIQTGEGTSPAWMNAFVHALSIVQSRKFVKGIKALHLHKFRGIFPFILGGFCLRAAFPPCVDAYSIGQRQRVSRFFLSCKKRL